MAITLTLTPDLEERLSQEAARQGLAPESCAMLVLERHLPKGDRREQLVSLLQSWIDEADPREQKETGDFLIKALDADRLSDRKLFPPELKGVTW